MSVCKSLTILPLGAPLCLIQPVVQLRLRISFSFYEARFCSNSELMCDLTFKDSGITRVDC